MVVRDYLEATLSSWSLFNYPALLERFVLRNGTEFPGAKRPSGFRKREDKQCYLNSTLLMQTKGWEYWEGIAITSFGFPVPHAWNIVNGVVVDSTWKEPQGAIYMGVRISEDDVSAHLEMYETYGVLDTGCGLNTRYMYRVDPELKPIIDSLCKANANA